MVSKLEQSILFEDIKLGEHSAVVTFTQVAQIISILLVDIMIVKIFGASRDTDAYFVAYLVPLVINGIVTGAVGSTFIPYWLQKKKNTEFNWIFISRTINSSLVFLVCISIVGIIFRRYVVLIFASGFQPVYRLKVYNMLIFFFLSIIFLGISSLLQAILRANFLFLLSGLGIVIRNMMLFIAIFLLQIKIIEMLSAAFFLCSVIEALYSLICVIILMKPKYHFSFGFKDSTIRELFRKACFPGGSQLLFQGRVVAERILSSFLTPGSVTIVTYARKLFNVLMVLAVQGVQVASLPALSVTASQNREDMRRTLKKSIEFVTLLATILMFIPLALGNNLISLLFQRGNFTAQDVVVTSRVFAIFLLAIPINAIARILVNMLYATHRQEAVFKMNVISIFFTIFMQFVLFNKLDVYAMAIGNTSGLFLGCALSVYLVKKYCNDIVNFLYVFRKLFLLLLLAGLTTLPIWILRKTVGLFLGNFFIMGVTILLSMLIYWFLLIKSGIVSIPSIGTVIRIIHHKK